MAIRNKILTMTAAGTLLFSTSASATEIERNTAQMQAMDKITGRVTVVEVPVNSEVAFGSFSIVVRDCKTTPPEETPENYAFVDVADSSFGKMQFNIFKGWMMSSSPALNAVEHPIYDVWLLKCLDTNVDKSKLMSPEQLKERDALPKLADIKQESEASEDVDVKPAEEVAPIDEQAPESVEKSEEKVLEDFTKPAELKEQLPENDTKPMVDETVEVEDEKAAEKPSGPQSLLNIEPEAVLKTVPAAEQASEENWAELPSAAEAPLQTQPAAEEAAPLVAPEIENEVVVSADKIVEETAPDTTAKEEGNVPENLPEDEEDQFIDLSSEADTTAALEAELSAEALRE